jgi:hypothetical protein
VEIYTLSAMIPTNRSASHNIICTSAKPHVQLEQCPPLILASRQIPQELLRELQMRPATLIHPEHGRRLAKGASKHLAIYYCL